MSDGSRNMDDMKRSYNFTDSKEMAEFYDCSAQTYEQDLTSLNYRAPYLGAELLNANFSGRREEVQVLDVACGSGWVAKVMVELGFRHFVGVDGSKGMLEQAEETGLYQDLRLALLGTQPLPAQRGAFDVVIIAGALNVGFIPVSVVRELCDAAKPGGFICMVRGDHLGAAQGKYKKDLERELQLIEDEGLWSLVAIKQTDRYINNLFLNTDGDTTHSEDERFLRGMTYLYKKSMNPSI